jgi:hypothetical protein
MSQHQPLPPILTAHLFPRIEGLLLDLLRSLTPDEWELQTIAPQWKVKDVAAHLLDTQLRKLSLARDGYFPPAPPITDLAAFINQPVGEMKLSHTRPVGRRVSLKEFANGDCTFFDPEKRGCTIYPVRPRQCRTWPFWNSNLESPETWQEVQEVCPGAGKGNFFSLEEIEAQAAVIRI